MKIELDNNRSCFKCVHSPICTQRMKIEAACEDPPEGTQKPGDEWLPIVLCALGTVCQRFYDMDDLPKRGINLFPKGVQVIK